MKKTGFLYDERYLLHDTGTNHPEVPARLPAVYQGIAELAAGHSQGRLISVLEGGYCLERLPELAKNHIEILLNAYR